MESTETINSRFEEIRSYNDSEVSSAVKSLVKDSEFRSAVCAAIGPIKYCILKSRLKKSHSKEELQRLVSLPFVKQTIKHTSSGLTSDFSDLDLQNTTHLFISNHRDIVLDSAILSYLLIEHGSKCVEIAIGDNLLIKPWIRSVARLNRSFIVHRSLPPKELLESSRILSDYIRYRICTDATPCWIAQREGRAKDSNDRTQKSVLKMLAMSGDGTLVEKLSTLNITPLSINYEYDPCDYLKAKEFQLKRDNADYRKSKADDILNMKTGIMGYKGRIHYCAARPINDMLKQIDQSKPVNVQLEQVAQMIDKSIFSNYGLFTTNYVAYDLLTETDTYSDKYTPKEKKDFAEYIENQLKRIDIPNPDIAFLRTKLLEIYANIVINKHSV